jgi:hypothetical protein
LIDRNSKIIFKLEARLEKNSGKIIGIVQKLQPEKVQVYPVMPDFVNNW